MPVPHLIKYKIVIIIMQPKYEKKIFSNKNFLTDLQDILLNISTLFTIPFVCPKLVNMKVLGHGPQNTIL